MRHVRAFNICTVLQNLGRNIHPCGCGRIEAERDIFYFPIHTLVTAMCVMWQDHDCKYYYDPVY